MMAKDQSEKDRAINLDPLVRVLDLSRIIHYAVIHGLKLSHLNYRAPLASLTEHAASHLSDPRTLLFLIIVEVLHEAPQLVLLPLQPLLGSLLGQLNFGVNNLLHLVVRDMRGPLLIFTSLFHSAYQCESVGQLRFLVICTGRRRQGVLPFRWWCIKVWLLVR